MSTDTPRIEKIGRRWYAFGWPRDLNERLRERGTWDNDRRGWYTGRAEVASTWQAILDNLGAEKAACVDRVKAAHEAGLCTWTKAGDRWVVTGAEATLRAGTVTVQAKGKAPEQVKVANVRRDGDRWIADRIVERERRNAHAATGNRGGFRRELPLLGTREGATDKAERRLEGRVEPDLGAYVGQVRAMQIGRGKDRRETIVYILGAEAHYTTADQEEDMGVPGTPSGWWLLLHVRPATPEEAAPLLEERAKREAEERARAEREAAELAAWRARVAELEVGKVAVCGGDTFATDRREVARRTDPRDRSSIAYFEATAFGEPCLVRSASWSADWRVHLLADRELALQVLDAMIAQDAERDRAAGREPTTPEKASEWLAKYAGCEGSEKLRRIAGDDPWPAKG